MEPAVPRIEEPTKSESATPCRTATTVAASRSSKRGPADPFNAGQVPEYTVYIVDRRLITHHQQVSEFGN